MTGRRLVMRWHLRALICELCRGYTTELLTLRTRRQEAVEQRFRAVFDNAAVAIAIYDSDGITIDANPTAERMVGMSRQDLRGVSGLDHMAPEDREKLRRVVVALLKRGRGTEHFEGRFRRADGSGAWGAWTMTIVHGEREHELYVVAVGEDVTERRALQQELMWQARRDPLTGLPNRRWLIEQLRTIVVEAGPADHIGLCFADLDAFKLINDRYGHGIGDRVLAEVGRRLDAALTSPTVTPARLGGDEFVVLLAPPCDDDAVGAVAAAVLATLREPVRIGPDDALTMSASVGAVVAPVAGANAESLLVQADIGLYRAKADGRGTWVLHHADDEPPTGREAHRPLGDTT